MKKVASLQEIVNSDEEKALELAKLHKTSDTNKVNTELISLLTKIRKNHLQIYSLSQEKIAMAKQLKFIVNAYTERLDNDLEQFRNTLGDELSRQAQEYQDSLVYNDEDYYYDEDYLLPKRESFKRKKSTSNDNFKTLKSDLSKLDIKNTNATTPPLETWCYCKQVSYGEMIACERGSACKIEWFHYSCVGLKKTPKGAWYCRECTVELGL